MKTRYSDVELAEFRVLLEQKLSKADKQLEEIQEQIIEVTESNEDGFGTDLMEDSSVGEQIDFLNEMLVRQKKYINQLENALIRIQNRTYGICSVSGELIDKRRLLAVPTTTKSLNAKVAVPEKKTKPTRVSVKPKQPVIISKVVKKANEKVEKTAPIPDTDDDDDIEIDAQFINDDFDFDSIPDEVEDVNDIDFEEEDNDDDL